MIHEGKELKKEEKKEERKAKTSIISFFICLFFAILLMVGGAIVPPPFVIDASIFSAVGWLFAFAALGQLPAILDGDKWAKITHGTTTVLLGDKDDMDRHHRRGPFGMGYAESDVEEEEEYYDEDRPEEEP